MCVGGEFRHCFDMLLLLDGDVKSSLSSLFLLLSLLQRQNYIDVATGSLGQGLSVAAGMAYCGKYIDKARSAPHLPPSLLSLLALQCILAPFFPPSPSLSSLPSLPFFPLFSLRPSLTPLLPSPPSFSSFASYRVFCMLGDGESAEGSVWEATAFSSHYKLDNLVAIVDVNRYTHLVAWRE